ncbi:hypothetical protein PspLS_11309 [Pyricularia sp. CBS 133598]|nr:hypothetical protein PspLS_11309 [Pyricularia sp. CBS 133598]
MTTQIQVEQPVAAGKESADDGPTERQAEETIPSSNPRIGYVTEYRWRQTNQLISSHDTKSPPARIHKNDRPAFEVVQTFKRDHQRQPVGGSTGLSLDDIIDDTFTPSSHSVRIMSSELRNAIQNVVRYYPDQDLGGDAIEIQEPYMILVHHYDELREFARRCEENKNQEGTLICEREVNAPAHIRLLLDFLDNTIMTEIHAEKERNSRGLYTWQWAWLRYKPGSMVFQEFVGSGGRVESPVGTSWGAQIVHSVRGGTLTSPPGDWVFVKWRLELGHGPAITRVLSTLHCEKFDGEMPTTTNNFFPDINDMTEEQIMADPIGGRMLAAGRAYWSLLVKSCMQYNGPMATFPYNIVKGSVMTDIEAYIETQPFNPPDRVVGDIREWISDCSCSVCRTGKSLRLEYGFGPADFEGLDLSDRFPTDNEVETTVDLLAYLLLPEEIPAYVFRTRTWEKLWTVKFSPAQFKEDMINDLVMDDKRLQTLKALSKSFVRENKMGRPMKVDHQWSADFVEGKGSGLIFLLHGSPGIGKTFTAECIAEYVKRPLMVLTSSDIGTDPTQVEKNLERNFKTATSWGAVLLIDEADVFMERRSTQDLVRNSLVAGFLRALEFYRGILFLTTNRVGSFDDAFISRIHVQLRYPPFKDEERQKVWQTFISKLDRDRGDTMRLNLNAREYIEGKEIRDLQWNGREIRNAFQTAVALAEFESELDADGKIVVKHDHLRSVVELSRDFKSYLKELHQGDEAKRALRYFERMDSHDESRR